MHVYFVGVNACSFLRAAAVSVSGSFVQYLSCVNVGISRYMCMVQRPTTVTRMGLLSCDVNVETGSQIPARIIHYLHWCDCVMRTDALCTNSKLDILFVIYLTTMYVHTYVRCRAVEHFSLATEDSLCARLKSKLKLAVTDLH